MTTYKVIRRNGKIVACGPNADFYQPVVEPGDVLTIEQSMPPLAMPASCTPWQIRKALNALGLRQQIEDAVAQSEIIEVKDGWQFANVFRSDDPFVLGIGAAIGKTESEVQDIIIYASTL